MYIKIDEDKFNQLKNICDSFNTLGLILSDYKISIKNEHIANLILSLAIPCKQILDEGIFDNND